MAVIYKITNLINNKKYIGQFDDPNKKFINYWGSGFAIKTAINKYGIENFKKEIIVEGNFHQTLKDELEKHYIRVYNTIQPYGYNLTSGGQGAGLIPQKVNQYTTKGEFIKTWNSTKEIGCYYNISNSTVRSCCNGTTLTCNSFIFLYLNSNIQNRLNLIEENKKLNKWTSKECYYKPLQYSLDGTFIKAWNSCNEVANTLNYNLDVIRACLLRKNTLITYKGFIWAMSEEDAQERVLLIKNKKKTINIYKENNLIQTVKGLKEAAKFSGYAQCTISALVNGKLSIKNPNYTFEYTN